MSPTSSRGGGATALLVTVPEAEGLVGPVRAKHDPIAARGVPAHITLLFPFVPASEVADELGRLEGYFAGQRPFDYELTKTGKFGGDSLWLAPEPGHLFLELARGLWARYPDTPPYEGAFNTAVFHLTVAHAKNDKEALDAIAAQIEPGLPIACRATEVALMEEGTDGVWTTRATFPLSLKKRPRHRSRGAR